MCLTWKKLPQLLLAFCVLGLIRTAPGAAAGVKPRDAKAAEPILFPDGVIDSDNRIAFVSSPKAGIQAVRLDDGKVLWANDACAAQPWIVAGNRLIARGERVFVLDIKDNGKVLRECDALDFPKLTIPERCTVSFPLWDPHVTGDTLEARWHAVAYLDRRKGRPLPAHFQAWTAFNKAVPVGTVAINLDTGKSVLKTDPKSADVSAGLILDAAKPENRLPAGLNEKLATVWRQYHKDENGRIAIVGNRLVGVSMTLEKMGQAYQKKITLNAWNAKTGAAGDAVELVKDSALNIANIVLTEDRRHAGVVFSNSSLTIYSLTNGKVVAKDLKGVSSPEKAFVDGKRLYYTQLTGRGLKETPNMLKAIDLESGKMAWECALKPRSTIPLPP